MGDSWSRVFDFFPVDSDTACSDTVVVPTLAASPTWPMLLGSGPNGNGNLSVTNRLKTAGVKSFSVIVFNPHRGDRVKPGAASAPGSPISIPAKSPLGATEIARSCQLLPWIPVHSQSGRGETETDSTRSPRWGFLSHVVAFHPGAEATPGFTRSPLCGLRTPRPVTDEPREVVCRCLLPSERPLVELPKDRVAA